MSRAGNGFIVCPRGTWYEWWASKKTLAHPTVETMPPHFHAKYQGQDAVLSIKDGALLAGDIPNAKIKLVQAWIEIHREELMADWELAVNGEPIFRIDPLR